MNEIEFEPLNNKYNGWSNYATWRINLEILSDYDFAQQVLECGQLPTVEDLKDVVENWVFENHTGSLGLVEDYARAFICEVNYHEILEHIIEEIEMNEEYKKMANKHE
tara:strand:+ start:1653 stop:1976 length:324 start_codon:yes stop_codon:yes gene_type:complete